MATDFSSTYGVDFGGIQDLDASLSLSTGNTGLGEALARRLLTPRGGLFYDRDFGYDIRRFLKASGFSASQIARTCEQEMLKDERVRNVAVEATYDEQYEELTISARVYPVNDQAFDLTISVDSLSIDVLNEDVVL